MEDGDWGQNEEGATAGARKRKNSAGATGSTMRHGVHRNLFIGAERRRNAANDASAYGVGRNRVRGDAQKPAQGPDSL